MAESSDAGAPALAQDLRSLLDSLAAALETPLALLSRDNEEWRFEGEAFPPGTERDNIFRWPPSCASAPSPASRCGTD